jgi:hypothetical protein
MKMLIFLQTLKFLLNRETAYVAIKKISFTILLLLITSELYATRYGKYQFDLSITNSFISSHFDRLTFSLIVFMALFFLSYVLETRILPIVGILYIGKYDSDTLKPFRKRINKRIFNIAPKEEIKEAMKYLNQNKREYYVYISFLPNILILLFIWISFAFSFWFLLFIPLILGLFLWLLKINNTVIHLFS